MLKPEDRFFALEGSIYPGGPSTWYVMDWDQRRLISVTMDEELESADPAIEQLSKHVDDLEPDVFELRVSSHGDLISTSTNPEDDNTFCPFYPPLEATGKADIQTIPRSKLEELDRLGPLVDLVTDLQSSKPSEKLVFKYYFVYQRMSRVWNEMNLWMRLPKHPNIVSFDKIVVDELEGRCIGFTTKYIAGGTLDENKSRIFKLKWLHQLIAVIDELNLNLGIAHQDVALRNLVIDDLTDSLMIFDFNFSARIGDMGFSQARNDVDGVIFTIYELITGHDELRSVEHEKQNVSDIEGMKWIKHPDVQLDHPVAEFRKLLDQWSTGRRKDANRINIYKDAPNYIEWPGIPRPPPSEIGTNYITGPMIESHGLWSMGRRDMLEQGKAVLNWQRPAQTRLKPGERILETGKYI
ncbi:Ff.00g042180.m01.CDS01 [Fusarium sp. VM40]|nr:Ff.00g042180.m01.CDS01 [Fusarium sp. VM40]